MRALDPDIPANDEISLNELVRDTSAPARALVVLLAVEPGPDQINAGTFG